MNNISYKLDSASRPASKAFNPKVCKDCGMTHRTRNPHRCQPCTQANIIYQTCGTGSTEASNLVNRLVRQGLLQSPRKFLCADCQQPAREYDHRDYNLPLEIAPVCSGCNSARGSAIPKKMSFGEFMAAVCATHRFDRVNDDIFELLRRRYWPDAPAEQKFRAPVETAHPLLDDLFAKFGVRSDEALASRIGLPTQTIRRIRVTAKHRLGYRPNKIVMSSDLMITLHEKTGVSISRIKELTGAQE